MFKWYFVTYLFFGQYSTSTMSLNILFKWDFQRSTPKNFFISLFWGSLSFFLWPHLLHMEVPRLGVELELQLLVYATATAMPDP